MKKRTIDNNWSFVGANTKEYSHCYHIYPAMMIPQIARRLIKEYAPKDTKIIFDPYCGTGTTLVESKLAHIDSYGTDLNPLAQLISKTKVTNYDINKVNSFKNFIADQLFQFSFNSKTFDFPILEFKNIDFWFSKKSISEISFILNLIETQIDNDLKDFFIVPLSETLREVSYTRNSEFKLYRIQKEKIERHNPDTFGIYLSKLNRNINGLVELTKTRANTSIRVSNFNTCSTSPEDEIGEKIDFVVTSPPYGDSRTTVAYGQFSRLSNQWLGIENASQIDNLLMGGKNGKEQIDFETVYAKKELEEIKQIDKKRFKEVSNFLLDYQNSMLLNL